MQAYSFYIHSYSFYTSNNLSKKQPTFFFLKKTTNAMQAYSPFILHQQ